MQNALKKMFAGLRSFWSHMNEGPQSDYERNYLCSVAPMSAEMLRGNEEAERGHH
jgi:hypothetical protein